MHVNEIVFFAKQRNEDGTTELSIVSPHRSIEATLIHQSWELKRSTNGAATCTASNTPLETVTYAEPQVEVRLSPEELIVNSGQNATQLTVDIDESELPCLLTTGVEVATHRIEVKGRLAIKTWAETADFQAEQSYWTTRYQKQIDAGDEFLKPRLDDYANELRLAEKMYFKTGDRLPVSFENNGTLCVGCLILDAIDGSNFEGQLFTNLQFDDAKIQLERNVPSDNGKQIRQIITSDLHCLSD